MIALTERNLSGIQVLRGVAAFAVVLHHVLEESQVLYSPSSSRDAVIRMGASGVDIFFVISGFIMLYSSFNKFNLSGVHLDFFARRIIRIAPLYWICTLFVVMLTLSSFFYKNKAMSDLDIIYSFLFLPTENIVYGIGWTLQYEMYFYLIFAFFLRFGSPKVVVFGLPAVLLLFVALSQLLPIGPNRFFLSNPIVLEFCFGVGLAYAIKTRQLQSIHILPLMLIAIVGIVMGGILGSPDGTAGLLPLNRVFFWGIPAVLLVYASANWTSVNDNSYFNRMLLLLGDASYSIYLTHAIVMTVYARILKNANMANLMTPLFWMLTVSVTALIVGIITYLFVERPIDRFLRSKWGKSTKATKIEKTMAAS